MSAATPRELLRVGDSEFKIVWEDGHESVFTYQFLRRRCPCALCVNEWTRQAQLDPATVPFYLKAEKAELVGNYAVAFKFSDGHATGVFTFERLRELCPCGACARSAAG